MIKCIRTNSDNKDFRLLVTELDADLKIRDGEEHLFYAQFNKIDRIKHVVVVYLDDKAVGCGAIKEFSSNTVEVKRMYVQPDKRKMGIASLILKELENWAVDLNYSKCVLETGKKQPEALRLYAKNGYSIIPNYGQYANVENSVCFEKNLK
jgi:putative acetyltransferase